MIRSMRTSVVSMRGWLQLYMWVWNRGVTSSRMWFSWFPITGLYGVKTYTHSAIRGAQLELLEQARLGAPEA